MALCHCCRSLFPYSRLHIRAPPLLVLSKSKSKPICFFPEYPSYSSKFTNHPHRKPPTPFSCTFCSSSMETPPPGYRRNVGICLINPSKKGGIDDSEDPKVAAVRELKEETGVSSADVLAEVPYWLTYDFPPDVREKLKHQWGSDWKGQAQKWFLLKFTGKEEEINLLGDGTEKPEFGEWSWMSPEQIIDRAVDFKKPVYKEVLSVFAPHLQ
ncbi:hypothetical protein REPUB_Repub13aG0143100 [Reevesia pubescens]